MNLSNEQIELAMSPLYSFYYQLKQEVDAYKRIKDRDWKFIYQLADFRHIGQLFIALKIAYGLTQRDLANLLRCTEAQISRDERNEYHGISLERTMPIMEALRILPPFLQLDKTLDRDLLFRS